jgi:hypothetical protein
MIKDILNEPNFGIPGFRYDFNTKLSTVLSDLFIIIFYLAGFLTFFWLVWGAFQYIFAGGDKEKLGKARARMTWAIVGLFFVILAYTLTVFVFQVLKPNIALSPPFTGISN